MRGALAAGWIGDPDAINPLAGLSNDPHASVRACAVFALREIEDSTAAEPLAALLRMAASSASGRTQIPGGGVLR